MNFIVSYNLAHRPSNEDTNTILNNKTVRIIFRQLDITITRGFISIVQVSGTASMPSFSS